MFVYLLYPSFELICVANIIDNAGGNALALPEPRPDGQTAREDLQLKRRARIVWVSLV